MSSTCVRHPMTAAEHVCGHCGLDHCAECVVHPFGQQRAALCITCALLAAGVRPAGTVRPRTSRRQARERTEELRRAREAAAGDAAAGGAASAAAEVPEELRWLGDADGELPGGWHVSW